MHLNYSLDHPLPQTFPVTCHLFLDTWSCYSTHVIQTVTVIFWRMLTLSVYLSFYFLQPCLHSLIVIVSSLSPLFHVLVLRMLVPGLMMNQGLYHLHAVSYHCLSYSHRLFSTQKLFHDLENISVNHLCRMGRLWTTQIQGFLCFYHPHTDLTQLKKKS